MHSIEKFLVQGGLREDNSGTWDYAPRERPGVVLGDRQWFRATTQGAMALLGDFAQVESVELHARGWDKEWDWAPDQPMESLISKLSSHPSVDSVVIWLSLCVCVGEKDIQQSAAHLRIAAHQRPVEFEISLNLDSNAYAGRPERLGMEAVLVNRSRLSAFLRRIEAGLDVVFNYCESQAFPDQIDRYGYRAP